MSNRDDYRNEMLGMTISDQEIERLLTAQPSEDGGLTDLVPFVALMRSYGAFSPSEATIDRFATEAATMVRSQPSSPVVTSSTRLSPASRRFRLRPRLAAAVVAIVLFSGLTGVAVAADGAAPGDPLYGIDRALEKIRIGAGDAEERLDEANTLLARGQAKEALSHAGTALDEVGEEDDERGDLEEANVALDEAAQNLPNEVDDGEQAAVTRENVAALLQYMRDNVGGDVGADGQDFGRQVADLARGISGEENAGNSTDPPEPSVDDKGPPDTSPGQGSGNGNGNGNGNGAGNGPPEGSPSETAPGQVKKP